MLGTSPTCRTPFAAVLSMTAHASQLSETFAYNDAERRVDLFDSICSIRFVRKSEEHYLIGSIFFQQPMRLRLHVILMDARQIVSDCCARCRG